ncbi:hypothetical protein P4O66_001810 [Electrophorus voltai]|uniref:Laminin G domain-containing protein n=1 Tax=Electrophorus voltai TaxID=2609070 RepID=A0AAD9DS60_9TELE|nr:hypothetical protein P4O66_001810 [Electrophorus voltai]
MKTLFLYGLVLLFVVIAQGASFYGDGFVHLKTVEMSGRNTLQMRFRTSSQRGVLFLAAGQADYLLLELSSGQLQVRLDLGSGERILHSDRGNPLNDFAWHTVEFLHDWYNVTLTVDKYFQTSQRLPGPQQELSIKDGLYVGGTGGLDKLYLPSDIIGFRGCLEGVLFNQHNLLSSLRSYSGLKNVYEVSLGCSPLFFASEEDPISFFSSRAYISLPTWSAQHEWLLECSVHTSAKEGIIMYNSARQGDFVTMEIQEGLLAAVVGRDGVKTEIRSLTFINDKKWHHVKLYFTSKSLQLTVDGETVKSSISSRSKALQLKGFLFLGGVDDSTRAEVKRVGLASVAGKRIKGGSFKGCFRDIKVNGVSRGLPNAVVTKDISLGCEPEKEPEISTTMGPTTVPGTFLGSITQLPPIGMSTLAKGLVKKYGQNFLQLRNLVVPEGGRASLDSKHIKVNLDFKKLGIRQSQIVFRIDEQPVHGQLSSRKETPSYLKGHKLYRFNVTVTPTNDAPELSLPDGNLFTLLENSRKKLTTEVLKATDVDSNFAELVYSVLGNLNADAGFLEMEDNPGQSVTSFHHSALVAGKISYVHTGVRNSRMALRVSDGEKVSNTVVLRIMAVGLEYSIANNTGLEVTQGEMGLINTSQLAVQTNAVRQAVDIRYEVTEPPRFEKDRLRYLSTFKAVQSGESKLITKDELFAETLSTKEMYYTVTKSPKNGKLARINLSNSTKEYDKLVSFTYQDILEERLMYVHDNSETTHDQFSFIASTSLLVKSSVNDDEVGSKEGLFNISIQLLNDEKPVRTVDKVFHVVRDGQRLLTVDDLCYHDADSDFSDGHLIYTRRGIPVGDLVLVNDTTHKLYQFRQEDLEQKRVLFVHRGASSGRFVFFVSDGKHYVSSLLDISAQDPYLQVANNTGLLVQKGQAKTFSNANFSVVTNLDIRDDSDITFEVHDAPKHGWLFLKDKNIESFTQHELKNMLLSYRHDNSKTLGDFLSVAVKAEGLRLEARINVRVYLESHQRPPVILHHKTLLVEEGKPVKIERITLEVTHEANIPSEIIFNVKVVPAYGYLRGFVDGEDRYQGTEEKPLMAFTQQDINAGNIQYVQIMPNRVNDTFILEASNGVAEVSDIILSVDIIPHFIPVEVSNITLKEEGPMHGHIENSRFPGIPTTYFTRKQVDQEFIYYVHDNSETLEDHFTITANDTNLRKHSAPRTVYVQVIPVNDEPPVVTANKVLRVWVGSVTEITPEDMNTVDEDSGPEELRYITTQPSNGHLALKSAPTRPIMDFSQAHIDQGQLLFVHSGAMAGGFHFQVNDGVNFTPRQIFSVTARALVLHLEKSGPLKVFPGSLSSISKEVLRAVTNDDTGDSSRTILFTVLSPPKFGKLVNVRAAEPKAEIMSFTQEMVDEGDVAYEQNVNSGGWMSLDKFTFTVSSALASTEDQTFDISISYENAEPERRSRLLKNTGAVVTEGDKVVIDKATLDASNLLTKQPETHRDSYEVWYQIRSLPQHGNIVVGERNLTKEKPFFSQFILNKYGITYQHDNSETLHDHFVFDAFLNLKSKPAQRPVNDGDVVEEVFNITIIPVNDQPPILKTKALRLKVVQGDTVALGPSHLSVADLDNPPDQIQYTVISKPSNGYLALAGSLNVSADAFSQAQINNGEVFFVQDGSPLSGVFYFSVTDGHHRPVYKLFNLEVLEIAVSLINHTQVVLEQGKTTVVLTESHLTAVTNGKNTTVHYKITSPPRYGKLLLDNEEVVAFDQEDLQARRLSYHMVNLVSSQDTFEFTAFTSEANLTDQVVNITVKPLIRYGESVKIPNGIHSKIRADYLNASELALMSGSDPLFEILSPPMYGKILYIESNNGNNAEPVRTFAFSELQQEKLAIEVKANLTGVQEVNDSFIFIVKADNLQPANGEFVFTIVSLDSALMITALPLYTSSTASPSLTSVMRSVVLSTSSLVQVSQVTKPVPKFKGRSRWGNTNINSNASAIPKTTHGQEITPVRNTPVRIESAPQESSTNPILIVLPLLALLLLVIVVVLVLLLRQNQQKKQKPLTGASFPPASPDSRSCQGHPERSARIPLVTVTPLSPSNPGSPALTRLQTGSGNFAYGPTLTVCSFGNLEQEASHFCRTTNPTLQHNQYWV